MEEAEESCGIHRLAAGCVPPHVCELPRGVFPGFGGIAVGDGTPQHGFAALPLSQSAAGESSESVLECSLNGLLYFRKKRFFKKPLVFLQHTGKKSVSLLPTFSARKGRSDIPASFRAKNEVVFKTPLYQHPSCLLTELPLYALSQLTNVISTSSPQAHSAKP